MRVEEVTSDSSPASVYVEIRIVFLFEIRLEKLSMSRDFWDGCWSAMGRKHKSKELMTVCGREDGKEEVSIASVATVCICIHASHKS